MWTKEMQSDYHKKWRDKNREKIRSYYRKKYINNRDIFKKRSAKWYQENKERSKSNAKRWRIENKERDREMRRIYKIKNTDKIRAQSRSYYLRNIEIVKSKATARNKTPKGKFYTYRMYAGYRKIPFSLKFSQFVNFWQKPCFYCGNLVEHIGLDRVDNLIGYRIGNVVSYCPQCNMAKLNHSQESFIEMCRRVSSLHPKK